MIVEEKVISDIPVDGIHKMTTIDFPGCLAAVIFTRGCPWKCRYCHNPKLREYSTENSLSWDVISDFLKSRKGYLDGIVFSGGEPTMHKSLPEFLSLVREMGYKTAIHTNGFYPDMIRTIIKKGLVDYIAMDVKAPPRAYDRITLSSGSCFPVSKSIKLIISSGIDYEFRTTFHPLLLTENELIELMKSLFRIGVKRFYLQRFQKEGVRDDELINDFDICMIPDRAIFLLISVVLKT